jgi:hypothetical protein
MLFTKLRLIINKNYFLSIIYFKYVFSIKKSKHKIIKILPLILLFLEELEQAYHQ